MKKYFVKVNGVSYEVEIEEIGSGRMASPAVQARSAASSESGAGRESKVSMNDDNTGDTIRVNSPMPGTVLKLNVQKGSKVSRGQVLLILEAMKMENEIISPSDGTVVSVGANRGAQVNAGDILLTIEKK